tara:strand:- start:41521 stop:41820 length:300 start_codon:yes stop_codon:yes gene_type:complete
MKYKLIKDKHISGKRYVWYRGFCLGYINVRILENKDIDWPKYRADKTLRIDPKERWYMKYSPTAYPNVACKTVSCEEEAVQLIIEKHKEEFLKHVEEQP